MLQQQNLEGQGFSSALEFLALEGYQSNSCLVLDNHMPGFSGLELQKELIKRDTLIPIVFMSGASITTDIVKAIKGGAYQFLQKPFGMKELISSISGAIDEQHEVDVSIAEEDNRKQKLKLLTPRESQHLDLLCLGHSNKSISKVLGISISTVEFHRANLNKKLSTNSLSELILFYRDLRASPDA